jgi:threonyl-tRNA synthetase
VQVAVLSISERFNDYASEVVDALKKAGLRVEANLNSEKIGAKIRDATLQKVPYMLIIGDKEQQARVVAVRHRTEGDKGQMPLEELINRCQDEVATRGQTHVTA